MANSPAFQLPDPLGVRAAARRVLDETDLVRVDLQGLNAARDVANRLAQRMASQAQPPAWEIERHWSGTPGETANWLLALDAANFCFWGEPRWTVDFGGRASNGYWALVDAFVRAEIEGRPLHDARYLAELTEAEAEQIFRGTSRVPLFDERLAQLQEVGEVLLQRWDGEFLNLVEAAGWRAPALAGLVADELRAFQDVATWRGQPVPLLKRAQILAADLHGAFERLDFGRLTAMDGLTAFADYKVPQVLRALGVLAYRADLATAVDSRTLLAPSSPEEVAIRAGTIVGVDEIVLALQREGHGLPAYRVDWHLWDLGQRLGPDVKPYHLTRTTAY